MKDMDTYYGEGARKQLSHQDYTDEAKRLEAERKAKEKYEADEKIKAEIERKENIKKQQEKEAREKERDERDKRMKAKILVIKNEHEERERLKKERDNAIKKFGSLETEEMMAILNDGDDMQPYFRQMFKEGYDKYTGSFKKSFEELAHFNVNATDKELSDADVLFRLLFPDLAEFEKPFLYYLNNDEAPENGETMDSMIVSNFVVGNVSVAHIVNEKGADKLDEKKRQQLQKLYILNQIKNAYNTIYYSTLDENADLEKEIDEAISNIKYKGFCAEKNKEGQMVVIRPADDFTNNSRSRKNWLDKNPEKPANYIFDNLRYQLAFVKRFFTVVAADQKLPDSICGPEAIGKAPSSLNRAKYELREIRAAFMMQANNVNDYYLKDFNKSMAVLCDYEAGDFKELMREKPHIANLVAAIIDGPLCKPVEGKTQEQIFNELKASNPDAIKDYIGFVEGVAAQVGAEYEKRKFALAGYPKEDEKRIKEVCMKAADNFYFRISNLEKADLSDFDKYCEKPISEAFDKKNASSIIPDTKVITNEVSALARGWEVKDTFIFAMVYSVYSKARELYAKDKEKYGDKYSKIADIEWQLGKATNAVEKRKYLKQFEDFIRDNIDDKELIAPTLDYQLEYDTVRINFDNEYKQSVINDLKKVEKDTKKLAKVMVDMKINTFRNESEFHDQIFKDYIYSNISKEKREELQKELYNERLNRMMDRAQNVKKHTEEMYKRDELSNFKYNPAILSDIRAQIGGLVSKEDGVAAADTLAGLFENELSSETKEELKAEYKKNNIDIKSIKIGNEVYHDINYYDMKLAEEIDNNKADHGFTVVTAPEGGFNIRYDKDIIEIKKDIMEKTDAQYGDLKVELAKMRNTMNMYIMQVNEGNQLGKANKYRYINSYDDTLYYHIHHIATMDENMDVMSYITNLKGVLENIDEPINKATRDGLKDEVKFFEDIKNFAKKSLDIVKPENYPDVDFYTPIRTVKKDVEVTRILWQNKDEGNKWEPKPSEFVENKQKNVVNSKEEKFFQALAAEPSRKILDYDEGYEYKYLFLKPSKIYEMCEKYFNALVAIDGEDVSKECKEYQDFYYSLKDLKENFKPREVSQIDGSYVTLDCLEDLNTTLFAYLECKDPSKNASLRKNVADQINRNYLNVKSGFDVSHNLDKLEKWVKSDNEVKKAIDNLPLEAKQKRQARIDAEKKAIEDRKQALIKEKENEKKLDEELKKIRQEERDLNSAIRSANKTKSEQEHQISVSKGNIAYGKSNNDSNLIQRNEKLINEANQKISEADKTIKESNDRLAQLDKQRADAKKKYAKKPLVEEKPKLKRQAVKDAMKGIVKENAQIKNVPDVNAATDKNAKKTTDEKKNVKKTDDKKNAKNVADKKPGNNTKNKPDDVKAEEPEKSIAKDFINENPDIPEEGGVNKDDVNKNVVNAGKKTKGKMSKVDSAYRKYLAEHTGENMGKTHKDKINNLAKIVTAYSLKKFSVSSVHQYMDYMKDNLNLEDVSEEKLTEYLATPKAAIYGGDEIRQNMFAIQDAEGYCNAMKKLRDNMMSAKGRSAEYNDLAKRIAEAAEIDSKIYANDEEKKRALVQSAFLVTFTIDNYMKGKKSVRTFEGGRNRFDNALDAAAIIVKYAPNSKKRFEKLIDRINTVRKDKNNKVSLDKYGADRAEQAKINRNNAVKK